MVQIASRHQPRHRPAALEAGYNDRFQRQMFLSSSMCFLNVQNHPVVCRTRVVVWRRFYSNQILFRLKWFQIGSQQLDPDEGLNIHLHIAAVHECSQAPYCSPFEMADPTPANRDGEVASSFFSP